MIWTRDEELAARLRRLRNHGERVRYEHVDLGMNSRLSALNAAVLRIKLRALPRWTELRRENAAFYDGAFANLGPTIRLMRVDPKAKHVYHQYSLFSTDRDRLREHLTARGIENIVYYPIPLHRQPCFADLGIANGSFANTEMACREVLSIPVHSELKTAQRQRVADAVVEFAGSNATTQRGR